LSAPPDPLPVLGGRSPPGREEKGWKVDRGERRMEGREKEGGWGGPPFVKS